MACKMEYSPTITVEAAGTAEESFLTASTSTCAQGRPCMSNNKNVSIQSVSLTQAQVTCHRIIYLWDPNDTSARCEGEIAEVSNITSHTALHSAT